MNKYKKILVVCPSNMTTGGPEALHQLVSHMRDMGLPAYLVYTPYDKPAQLPVAYQKYNIAIGQYEDKENNFIIFPEIYPMLALKVKYAKAAMWWLSLDNFLERKNISKVRDTYHYTRAVIRRRKPLLGVQSVKHIIHFSATNYVADYLNGSGITSIPLSDSMNESFLIKYCSIDKEIKQNIILFNPTKGKEITKRVMDKFSNYKFIPLRGYKDEELSKIFFSAKLYIDFGHFPGAERLPREAAIHGCCVLSGKLGCAANSLDFPIKPQYKLDTHDKDLINQFESMTESIFNNFEYHYQEFEPFRQYLLKTPIVFKQQIADYFLG